MKYPVSQPSLSEVEVQSVLQTLRNNRISAGPMVAEFERQFAEYLGVRHAVMTTSGTTALHLALAALGIGPGHEVLVPDMTYVATATAVAYTGAKVVLCDVDPRTWNIDLDAADSKITSRTVAIVPVALYGNPCDVRSFAACRKLHVVEDAAEGLGGRAAQGNVGTISDVGCFSFYANKMLTTGEGGMLVTRNGELAARARHLRGMATLNRGEYFHDAIGFNYRPTDLQGALGLAQLSRLSEMLKERQRVVDFYREFVCYRGHIQDVLPYDHAAPWLYTLRTDCSDRIAHELLRYGIETRPIFTPLHRMPMFAASDSDFPVASSLEGLSLPTYPELTNDDVYFISKKFHEVRNALRAE